MKQTIVAEKRNNQKVLLRNVAENYFSVTYPKFKKYYCSLKQCTPKLHCTTINLKQIHRNDRLLDMEEENCFNISMVHEWRSGPTSHLSNTEMVPNS